MGITRRGICQLKRRPWIEISLSGTQLRRSNPAPAHIRTDLRRWHLRARAVRTRVPTDLQNRQRRAVFDLHNRGDLRWRKQWPEMPSAKPRNVHTARADQPPSTILSALSLRCGSSLDQGAWLPLRATSRTALFDYWACTHRRAVNISSTPSASSRL
jgi:hypothetical protein